MACQVMLRSWSFPRLVGAFLDLAIAYCLLCCSAFAFFLSRFLALFGFTLPCPCNGLFGGYLSRGRGPCLNSLLVDLPTDTISSVQLSVKSKFPFDSILPRTDHCHLNLRLLSDSRSHDGVLELEGEASYTSFSDPCKSQHSLSATHSFTKPKRPSIQRPRSVLRRRRRATIDYSNLTSPFYDHVSSDSHAIHRSPSEPSKLGNVDNSTLSNFHGRTVPDSESNDATDEGKLVYDNATPFENLKKTLGHVHVVDGDDDDDQNAVRILELALEEEQVAREALCSELEQERLAAATAADEAMAMISRLQEEKASIEIEARQFQRILEEKSAYDAEEMDILKEIVVRREREKHFLEKEVEAYRKMFQACGESQSNDIQEQNDNSFLDFSVDPMLILQQLSESIDKQRTIENLSSYPDFSSEDAHTRTCIVSESKESSIVQQDHETKIINELESPCPSINPYNLQSDDESYQDIQEKGVLSMNKVPYPHLCKSSSSQGHNNISRQQNTIHDAVRSDYGEPHVHDVHIIDPNCSTCKDYDVKEGDQIFIQDSASNVERTRELPFCAPGCQKDENSADNSLKDDLELNRSSSDIVERFPTANSSPGRSFVSALRRNSLSAVDNERLRIDSEVGWLRERLRDVQEEKEKLKSSLENRDRGNTELQLLKAISSQLQEIRHLTAPEKSARQASLPPLSSKVMSKRRRSRSASLGVGQSESS